MQKKIIAWILLGALLLGFIAMAVSAETPAYYQVGYAKVDINPYYDEADHSQGLMPLPLTGNSYEEQRLSLPEKMDDNGDGFVDDNDGIFATCIAITDQAGNSILLMATDLIGAFGSQITTPVRQAIREKFPELTGDKVMIAGSHTHHSIGVSSVTSSTLDATSKACLEVYVERLKANLVKAAELAMADRSPARMYKGQIEANDAECATGLVGDTLNSYTTQANQVTEIQPGTDRAYNGVRHYRVDSQDVARTVLMSDSEKTNFYYYDFLEDENGYIADENSPKITYVGGNNFNAVRQPGSAAAAEIYWVKADGVTRVDEANIEYKKIGNWLEQLLGETEKPYEKGTKDRVYKVPDMKIVTSMDHVSETDDTMLITEFRFDDTAKKPIVLVNWRAHTNANRYVSDDYNTEKWEVGFYTSFFQVTADWINAFRYVLELNGYRPAYFNGAAGNVNMGSQVKAESAWISYETDTDRTHVRNKGNIYGSELAEVALELLKSAAMKEINTDGSLIRTQQISFHAERPSMDAGLFLAAIQYEAAYIPASPLGVKNYQITYWLDANGEPLISKANRESMVDPETGVAVNDPQGNPYVDANSNPVVGVTKISKNYAVASIQHANSVISKYGVTSGSNLELNAIMVGDEWAMVTAPNELFDRYSREATLDTMNDYNDWENILGSALGAEYGEPFVLGYCNNRMGYIPSYVTYDFTKDLYPYVQGSYETQITRVEQGTGEDIIVEFGRMLKDLNGLSGNTSEDYCEHCQKNVTWTALSSYLPHTNAVGSGHYYVDQEVMEQAPVAVSANSVVCLDLRGNTFSGTTRAFSVAASGELTILDSVGGGTVKGRGTASGTDNGGVIHNAGTLNIYGGNFVFEETEGYSVKNGGILYNSGTFNMYGGTLSAGHGTWTGGTLYTSYNSSTSLYGGSIYKGKADEVANTSGACIRGALHLSGNAYVEYARLWPDSGKEGYVALADMFNISGKYTGRIDTLILTSKDLDTDIGNATEDADLSQATIKVSGSTYVPFINGTDVILANPKVASATDSNGTSYATTLQMAVDACEAGGTVALLTDTKEDVTVDKNITLQLNGHQLDGTVTVAEGCTLSCMDAATDDFDITDGNYSKLKVSGNVKGAAATEEQNPYLMITEADGSVSFHAVGLNIQSMALNTDTVGLYYINEFKGDHMVQAKVLSYGVAVSISGAPTQESMGTTSKYTRFEGSTFGTGEGTSSMLYNVMKTANGATTNKTYAAMPVYGSAYIQVGENEYLFGVTRVRSLQEQVELADRDYFDSYKTQLTDLYNIYYKSMADWSIPNLLESLK